LPFPHEAPIKRTPDPAVAAKLGIPQREEPPAKNPYPPIIGQTLPLGKPLPISMNFPSQSGGTNYHQKYLKYKNKYLKLKNQMN
jgi:hypothetical protein